MGAEEEQGAGKRRPKPEELDPILVRLSEGVSLRQACEELGLDVPSTQRALTADAAVRQQYVHARALGGDVYAWQVVSIALKVANGKMKPDVGRVAMEGLKWAAGRMNRKDWGDKQQHEHTGEDGGPIQYANMTREQRQQRIAELQEKQRAPVSPGGD